MSSEVAVEPSEIHVKEAGAVEVAKFVPFGEDVADNNRLIERISL